MDRDDAAEADAAFNAAMDEDYEEAYIADIYHECRYGNDAVAEHTCPYGTEIHNDYGLCNCCEDCEHQCAMDI